MCHCPGEQPWSPTPRGTGAGAASGAAHLSGRREPLSQAESPNYRDFGSGD